MVRGVRPYLLLTLLCLGLYLPGLTVVPLSRSACPNMSRINLQNLLEALEGLGEFGKVELDEETSAQAKMALDRMLELA